MQVVNVARRLRLPQLNRGSPLVNTLIQSEQDQLCPAYWAMGGVRHLIKEPKYQRHDKDPNAIKCFGFNYYPRFPDKPDPPYEPTKLFAVRRVKPLWKRPFWERKIVEGKLGLVEFRNVAIVKNGPGVNAMLYRVKHLIEVKPITFPNGMPTENTKGFLKENGEYIVYDRLNPGEEDQSLKQIQEDVEAVQKRDLDGKTLRSRFRLQWMGAYDAP